jgi:hypothetical protein
MRSAGKDVGPDRLDQRHQRRCAGAGHWGPSLRYKKGRLVWPEAPSTIPPPLSGSKRGMNAQVRGFPLQQLPLCRIGLDFGFLRDLLRRQRSQVASSEP